MSQVGGREGDSFLSPEVQREKIEAWAQYRDYRVVHWYVDLDRSGREGSVRPEFDRMMRDAADHRFEAVAVYRLTRFARSVADAARRYSELRQHGIALVSVTEDIDTTTASGSFMQNMLFAMAEFESQRIGEEWRNVHASRRRRGIAHVARPMFGYVTDGAVIVGVDQAEARVVRELFNLRAGKGYNLGQLQDWLEHHGYRPKRGGARFSKTTIRNMLKNPTYAGMVRLPDGELVDGAHEAIVPRDVWDAVQATWPRTTDLARRYSPALLSGLLVCSGCGYRLRYEGPNGRYRCKWRDNSYPCPQPVTIKAGLAEPYVERLFLRRFDPKRMPKGGRIGMTRQQHGWQRKAAGLRSRVDELNQALDSLADQRYVKGSLTADEYDRQAARFLTEREQAQQEAERLDEAVASVRPLDLDALALWPRLDVKARRRALTLLIHEIVVLPAHGQAVDPSKRLEIGWLK